MITVVTPYTVVVDTREQDPYLFLDVRADARAGNRLLTVPLIMRGLPSGDYSLEGHEVTLAVERKSLADLFGTVGRGRQRFERELARLDTMPVAAVVVEATWDEIIRRPPAYSRLRPKVIHRSVIAWQQRYPRVHWWTAPGRRFAELTTLRILERFWTDNHTRTTGRPIRGTDQATN